MWEDEVDMRLPELIPDWVLTNWPEPLEPPACSCLHWEPELAEPTPVDPEPVDPELRYPPPELVDLELVDPELVDPELRYPPPKLVDPELGHRGPELAGWTIPGMTWQQPSPLPEPAGVTAAVRALQAAAAVVCAIDPTSLSAEQAMSDAEALQDLGQQLRVHGVRRLADVTTRELHRLRGFRSTAAWLRSTQPDADSSDAGLSRRLQGYQRLSTAVESGELSLVAARKVVLALGRCRPHVDQLDGRIDGQPGEQVITAVVGHVVDLVCGCVLGMSEGDARLLHLQSATQQIIASGPPGGDPAGAGAGQARRGPAAAGAGQLDRLEAAFVLLAEHIAPSLLTSCLEELVLAVVPSLLEDRAKRGRDSAGLSLQLNDDGSGWRLDADLDLQCGERLFTALRSELQRDPANRLDTAAAAALRAQGIDPWDPDTGALGTPGSGDGTADSAGRLDLADLAEVSPSDWPRSRRQRMHDAFDALLGRYLEHGLGGSSQKVPVQVNVTLSAALIDDQPGALPAIADSGAAIPRCLLQRWWCDSRVTAYVLNRGSQALRAVHLGRTLTGLERRAAAIEHRRRCAGVGCCRGGTDPTTELVPHHVRRYADDGATSLTDTILVCDVLHRDLHDGQQRVRLRNGRYLTEKGWV